MYQIRPIFLSVALALARRNLYLAWMERASPLSIYLTAVLSSIIAELATDCAHAHSECLQYECTAKVTKLFSGYAQSHCETQL